MKYLKTLEAFIIDASLMPKLDAEELYFKYISGPYGANFKTREKNFTYNDGLEGDFKEIITVLEEDCSEFLDELRSEKQYPLFRGARYTDETYTNGLYSKSAYNGNRKSLDTPKEINDIFNKHFKDKFGIALRNSGIFTSKKPQVASDYGTVYMFFPIGNYKYYWSDKVLDFFGDIEMKNWYYDCVNDTAWEDRYGEYSGNGVWSYMGLEYSHSADDTMYDIRQQNPSLSYDKIRKQLDWVPEKTYDEFEKDAWIECDKEIKKLVDSYTEGDLKNVVQHEITFICDKYYLVDLAFYNKMLEYLKLKSSN